MPPDSEAVVWVQPVQPVPLGSQFAQMTVGDGGATAAPAVGDTASAAAASRATTRASAIHIAVLFASCSPFVFREDNGRETKRTCLCRLRADCGTRVTRSVRVTAGPCRDRRAPRGPLSDRCPEPPLVPAPRARVRQPVGR